MDAADGFVYGRDGTMDVWNGKFHHRDEAVNAPDRTIYPAHGTMNAAAGFIYRRDKAMDARHGKMNTRHGTFYRRGGTFDVLDGRTYGGNRRANGARGMIPSLHRVR
jgi:hypothetical protein